MFLVCGGSGYGCGGGFATLIVWGKVPLVGFVGSPVGGDFLGGVGGWASAPVDLALFRPFS